MWRLVSVTHLKFTIAFKTIKYHSKPSQYNDERLGATKYDHNACLYYFKYILHYRKFRYMYVFQRTTETDGVLMLDKLTINFNVAYSMIDATLSLLSNGKICASFAE